MRGIRGRPTLQLGAAEILEDLLPVRRVVIAAEVGLQLSTEDLKCGTLANTVCANETQDLARAGHGQPVQLEAVGRVAVGDLGLEVGGQVDDVDGVKRALLGTDTTSYTKPLGDEGDFRAGVDLDAQLAGAHNGTRFFAFLPTFLPQRERVCVDIRIRGRQSLPWVCTAVVQQPILA